MATVKGNIFTFKGVTDVSDCLTAQDVMKKAHLDWTVAKGEVYGKMPGEVDFNNPKNFTPNDFYHGSNTYKPINNIFHVYRTDKNIPLGIVKERYTPVQNTDAFKFFNDAIGKDDVSWFTAGCSGNGEKIFVSAKLSDTVLVNGKDPIDQYLVFSTSHDGSSGVRIILTPIRLVCFNAMNSAIRNATSFITLRHTNSVHSKITEAQEILGITRKKIDFFAQCMEQMTKIKADDDTALDIFSQIIFSEKELETLAYKEYTVNDLARRNYNAMDDANISTKKVNQFCDMITYYHTGAGQREYLGTGYGVYNAINGYYSNCKNDEGIKRMDKLLYGEHATKIKKAGDLVLCLK